MTSLEFQPVKDAELSWIDARLTVRKTDTSRLMGLMEAPKRRAVTFDSLVEAMETDSAEGDAEETGNSGNRVMEETVDTTTCLDNLPPNAIPPHVAVFVNDPKLSDLKQLLMLNGFQAEFSGGVLYVNNVISIRRNEAGRFNLEGSTSDEYYRIRDLVYKQFAIV